jgi:predicted nucleic acid-binding protein
MTAQFVLDASVVLSWCFDDETSPYTDALLDLLAEGEAFVPSIWPLEIVNVLVNAERAGRLVHADALKFLRLIASLPITVIPESPARVFSEVLALAREEGLSSYDAAYLDLALREGLPLATQDRALRRAAKRKNAVILAP